jgi:biotin carboxylase
VKVLFLSPNYPVEMQDFTRGLAEVGADVVGVGDTPREGLSPKVKAHLAGYLQVSLQNGEAVLAAVRATGVKFDRIECLWEPFVELAAWLREQLGVPGMSLDTARAFRDKELMKQRVEAAGLRVPHHARAKTADEVRAIAERIGFPIILKPIAGAGSADTFRVNDARELEVVLDRTRHVTEVSVEEFVDGEEFTFDTVCIDGRPAYANIAQYHPRPLIARSNEWISPIVCTIRDMWADKYKPGIELGYGVLKALNMGSGFTHMEWYLTQKGEVVFGEIGARSAGGHLVDQMNWTGDIDLYREWARAVCWKVCEADNTRKYNVAIVFKRAKGEGHIQRIEGLGRYIQRYGEHVVAEQLLRPGTRRRDWLQTLVSDGFVCVRHPDLDATLRMANAAATDITLYAG